MNFLIQNEVLEDSEVQENKALQKLKRKGALEIYSQRAICD